MSRPRIACLLGLLCLCLFVGCSVANAAPDFKPLAAASIALNSFEAKPAPVELDNTPPVDPNLPTDQPSSEPTSLEVGPPPDQIASVEPLIDESPIESIVENQLPTIPSTVPVVQTTWTQPQYTVYGNCANGSCSPATYRGSPQVRTFQPMRRVLRWRSRR